jgi:2-polyprenyl-3-methyl-5-hydroxy-6-metoxy-1,4-benzoquinol methylase
MVKDIVEKINCPFCNADNGNIWASENGFNALKCNNCGFIYVSPRPKNEIIKNSVETGLHSYLSDPRSKVTRRIHSKITSYSKIFKVLLNDVWQKNEAVRWLDVGAGFGEILQSVALVAPANSYVEGIEPMKAKAEMARKFGQNVNEGYLEHVENKFDFISFINVFSHIDDIDDFLEKCNKLLNDSGELIIETGNAADLKSPLEVPGELDLPDHLMFAGEAHIVGLLDRAGFKVIDKISFRADTVSNFLKSIVKKLIGRQVNIVIPYTSPFRTLIYRAKKIA